MMISPETFYQEYLEGKSENEILKTIRSLKREIGRLKNIAEHPDYKCRMRPSEATRISCNRMYLKRAKEALVEVGGEYNPSRAEIKADEFENNMPFISKIIFSIGGFFEGYTTTTITVDEKVYKNIEHSFSPVTDILSEFGDKEIMTKEEFLSEFSELHIGEWRRKYDTRRFGIEMMDGTQWELEIYFLNGHKPVRICGDNAYPYNFERLEELIRAV